MVEHWKDVVGYEGIYQVSDLGRVKSLHPGKRRCGRILKQATKSNGYLQVTLSRHGQAKATLVHRLVLEAHIGPAPSPKHEGNHKNGDKTDNGVENLEWVTCSENHQHAFDVLGRKPTKLRGEACGGSRLTRKKVRRIRKLHGTGDHSLRELGRMFGVRHTTIRNIVYRKSWTHI